MKGPFCQFFEMRISSAFRKYLTILVSWENKVIFFQMWGDAPPAREIQSSYRLYGGVTKYRDMSEGFYAAKSAGYDLIITKA